MALTPVFGAGYTFITFYPAIMFSTVIAGWRYGLAATMISALLSVVLFMDPTTNPEQATALLVFLAVNGSMIVIADATARARRRAEMQAGLAEAREEGLRDEIEAKTRAEESLCESEERFRRSADAANALVFEVGLRDRSAPAKVYGLQRLIGFDPSEVRADYKW
jgi:glucose-6-phosphate-specific signal transduction histidine kinase